MTGLNGKHGTEAEKVRVAENLINTLLKTPGIKVNREDFLQLYANHYNQL